MKRGRSSGSGGRAEMPLSPRTPADAVSVGRPDGWERTPEGTEIADRTSKGTVMLWFILGLLLIGLVAGFVARAVVPGPDPMGVGGTLLLGLIGSFVGGF